MSTDTNTELTFLPKEVISQGLKALNEIRRIVQTRPDKLVVGGKQYLFFYDWQLLGVFFGITVRVSRTEPICQDRASEVAGVVFHDVIGFHAWAEAVRAGKVISAAESECLYEEANWTSKPRFQLLSMAETRACAKALRNCLAWVVKLPGSNIADDNAEEIGKGVQL